MTTDVGELDLRTLPLSDGAERASLELYNAIELGQAPCGRYVKVTKPQAGRAEEQAEARRWLP